MPRKYVERASALRSVGKALASGRATVASPFGNLRRDGTTVPHSWVLSLAGNCQRPVIVLRDGVRLIKGKAHRFGPHAERPVMTEMHVPCRQCETCLARRGHHWRLRALAEYRRSSRTWWGTITLTPERQSAAYLRAMRDCRIRGFDLAAEPAEVQFLERHTVIGREITLYVKRLRERAKEAELKFVCVLEAHESGLPHYHMLVHEYGAAGVKKHDLDGAWNWGFTRWRLVHTPQVAGYITKYLHKSALARVRASLAYGKVTSSDIAPVA